MKRLLRKWLGIKNLETRIAELEGLLALAQLEEDSTTIIGTAIVDKGITGTPVTVPDPRMVKGYGRSNKS